MFVVYLVTLKCVRFWSGPIFAWGRVPIRRNPARMVHSHVQNSTRLLRWVVIALFRNAKVRTFFVFFSPKC